MHFNNKAASPGARVFKSAWLLAGFGALLLLGCVHYQPKPLAPAETVEAFEARRLDAPELQVFLGQRLVRPLNEGMAKKWDLETLTLAAFYFHPDLDAARARWAVAEAGKVTAGQRPNPSVSVSPGYNFTTTRPTPWIVATSLDVPIETAGKRGKRLAQAQHLSEAARLAIATTAWDVRARLRRALLEFWSTQEAEAALAAQHAAQQDIVRLLEAARTAGASTLVEVTRERIASEQTRVALLDAQNRRTTARVQLATAVGVPSRALDEVKISFDAFTQPPGELPPAEARRRALLNRADVLAALAEYAAGEAALQLEIAKQFPDVHLKPGHDYDQGDNKWSLGLSLELPLLNQNQGPIAVAEARRREQAAKFNSLQARVLGEIEIALAGYDTARAKLAAAATVLEQLAKQERLAQAAFEAGEVSRQAVAVARLERTAAALAQIDARLKAQEALGQLENALQLPSELAASVELNPRPLNSQ
ncbi:MAG: TolC family protein [Verrucomicrobia bacterium]|nr:TolC family protein [Verrucomicrobiota bacterium]